MPARAATPAATRKEICRTAARSSRSRPMTSWLRSAAGRGRQAAPSRASARTNRPAVSAWPATLATAEPTRPRPAGCTSSGQSTRLSRLPASTYPTGRRSSCTPRSQPLPASEISSSGAPRLATRSHSSPAAATAPGAPASSRVSGPARSWNSTSDADAEAEGEPGRLHALGHRTVPVAGPGAAGGARRRAVGEEVQQRRGPGEQRAADRQPAERHGAEVADDRGVDEHVQRLRRQHDERRHGERRHGGTCGVGRPSGGRRHHRADNSARRAAIVDSRSPYEL